MTLVWETFSESVGVSFYANYDRWHDWGIRDRWIWASRYAITTGRILT